MRNGKNSCRKKLEGTCQSGTPTKTEANKGLPYWLNLKELPFPSGIMFHGSLLELFILPEGVPARLGKVDSRRRRKPPQRAILLGGKIQGGTIFMGGGKSITRKGSPQNSPSKEMKSMDALIVLVQ